MCAAISRRSAIDGRTSRGVRRLAPLGIAACLASCTSPPLAAGEPHVVDRLPIAAYAAHEACLDLVVGDRLDYRFQSSVPVDFEVRYREANATVSPIVRPHTVADSDIFQVRVAARYCLDWQAGADGAIIGYRVQVHRGGAGS